MEIAPTTTVTDEFTDLYRSVGWTAYVADPDRLRLALSNSHLVLTARADGELIGLARTISDGATICYLQDLLVRPDRQRQGVGRALLSEVVHRYRDCRAMFVTSDANARSAAFYRSVGFVTHEEQQLQAWGRPVGRSS